MCTRLATSSDGLTWTLGDVVLAPRPGAWDSRGVRVTAMLDRDPTTVLYDGRASAEANWFEQTGIARGHEEALVPADGPPTGSPHSDGALRYVSVVDLPGGGRRLYYELARPDGAHDLMSELAV